MVRTFLARCGICLSIVLGWGIIFLTGAATIVFYGPSPAARNLLVSTVMETSAAKFVARLYFSGPEIEAILAQNAVADTGLVTDAAPIETPSSPDPLFNRSAIEVRDVSGATFTGKMMIVSDPSRLYVASPFEFDSPDGGMRVEEMIRRDGAAAGVNAGGFEDINGVGNGAKPLGIVIQNGVLTFGEPQNITTVVGFDSGDKLVVGRMSAADALARGIRDAVSFSPALVINGEPASVSGSGGGLNPRTAIGQRADGAVLLLVVNGRQASSIGASLSDLIDVMLEFGAVNAANLDGGSSSLMVYNDEIITVCSSLYGSRKLPTAILVRQVPQ